MLHAHKQALERDLEDEKQRLAQLREARNSANHESLALRRDRKHLIAELRFLRHMAEEEEGLILVLQNSNQYLEASRGTLEASSAALAKISAEAQCKSLDWLTRLTPPRIRCLIPVVPLVSGEI
jgi:chromosome segregation ATPase